MADPAFLFYPGDYLRDTQCLSESVQVAYDRIMCEHMRNICIRQQQLDFFTKRLSDDQKQELLSVLTLTDEGYMIEWVAESINKRKAYSESRRENRSKKNKKDMNNISKSYDEHMENEIVIESKVENKKKVTTFIPPHIDEVRAYVVENNLSVSPWDFVRFYEAGGWKDSKGKPVKNWKQKILTWQKFDNEKQKESKPSEKKSLWEIELEEQKGVVIDAETIA